MNTKNYVLVSAKAYGVKYESPDKPRWERIKQLVNFTAGDLTNNRYYLKDYIRLKREPKKGWALDSSRKAVALMLDRANEIQQKFSQMDDPLLRKHTEQAVRAMLQGVHKLAADVNKNAPNGESLMQQGDALQRVVLRALADLGGKNYLDK